MNTSTIPAPPNKPRMRWLQVSLKSLLLITTVTAIGFAWVGNSYRKQSAAVEALQTQRVTMYYDCQVEGLPGVNIPWEVIKRDGWRSPQDSQPMFARLIAVSIGHTEVDAALPHLRRLPYLQTVYIPCGSCGNGWSEYEDAKARLERELPDVKIVLYTLPFVG